MDILLTKETDFKFTRVHKLNNDRSARSETNIGYPFHMNKEKFFLF